MKNNADCLSIATRVVALRPEWKASVYLSQTHRLPGVEMSSSVSISRGKSVTLEVNLISKVGGRATEKAALAGLVALGYRTQRDDYYGATSRKCTPVTDIEVECRALDELARRLRTRRRAVR